MAERHVIEREVYDAKVEAQRIIASAEQVRECARAEGRALGLAEARAIAGEQLVRLAAEGAKALAAAEVEAIEIALAVARRIVRSEVSEAGTATACSLVRELLNEVRRRRNITLRVHPSDAEDIQKLCSDWSIVADATISRGGCVLEGESFRVDARIEIQLDALEKAVRNG